MSIIDNLWAAVNFTERIEHTLTNLGVIMRLSVVLLSQYRVVKKGKQNQFRFCEKRVICVATEYPLQTLEYIYKKGKESNCSYINAKKEKVYFEFIGIWDYDIIGFECDEDEYWYERIRCKLPMENKEKYVFSKKEVIKGLKKIMAGDKANLTPCEKGIVPAFFNTDRTQQISSK
ncbi:hypothetical protein FACS1894170_10030 [Planctomycetales bacterium]|nr:hypothetical protein FACS1894170_10030 [Planctomycetales bacterium]